MNGEESDLLMSRLLIPVRDDVGTRGAADGESHGGEERQRETHDQPPTPGWADGLVSAGIVAPERVVRQAAPGCSAGTAPITDA
jgi:hypothetical protein